MQVEFKIEGEPKGKGRPRFTRQGNYVKTYTPSDTVDYEDRVRFEYKIANRNIFFENPIKMNITCFFGIPKSTSKKKRSQMLIGDIRPVKKPDADNVAKIIADALNSVAYKDDTQIVDLSVKRWYADVPSVHVVIEEV